jgi:radical SAM superfamily enzyme YgiQ (UPF0313 family)
MFVGVESFNRKTLKAAGKYHNYPEHYAAIVRLCHEAGIRAHFSNIIGFPDDNEDEIENHIEVLKTLHPKVASFYILTPIPGTEQYNDYHKSGLITEKNLDRFDTIHSTWSHPNLTRERLEDLLYHAYVSYYRFLLKAGGLSDESYRQAIYHRYIAAQRIHPMSGGVDRLYVDNAADYSALRRAVYDIDIAPLPDSLRLSPRDELLNDQADWRSKRHIELVST